MLSIFYNFQVIPKTSVTHHRQGNRENNVCICGHVWLQETGCLLIQMRVFCETGKEGTFPFAADQQLIDGKVYYGNMPLKHHPDTASEVAKSVICTDLLT